jgi:hypothetical protein
LEANALAHSLPDVGLQFKHSEPITPPGAALQIGL